VAINNRITTKGYQMTNPQQNVVVNFKMHQASTQRELHGELDGQDQPSIIPCPHCCTTHDTLSPACSAAGEHGQAVTAAKQGSLFGIAVCHISTGAGSAGFAKGWTKATDPLVGASLTASSARQITSHNAILQQPTPQPHSSNMYSK
jgi:hypothetical protein